MKRNWLLRAWVAGVALLAACGSARAFAPDGFVYTPPANKVGGAVSEGIMQALIRRGFSPGDPRIFSTIKAVGARVLPLAGAAGAGANWLGMVARLSPWVTAGIMVYQGLQWYFAGDGTVTTKSLGIAPGGQVVAGNDCLFVMGGNFCGATPEEAITSYILTTTTFTDLTAINLTPDQVGSTAYNNGRRYIASIAGHRNNDMTTVWQGNTWYYIYVRQAPVTCPFGFVLNSTQCVPNLLAKYVPQPVTTTGQSLQTAYNNLPQPAREAELSPELAAEITNRIWRDASAQPDYTGVPWSAKDPVQAQDFAPYKTDHPADWPKTSDINTPVPTTLTPVVSPVSNPNQTTSPSTATQVDFGPDPGVSAPTLDEPPSDLFKPIKDLLHPWMSWQVPAHAGQCPTWQAAPSIAGHVFNIDLSSHCELAEQYRHTIHAAAMACWVVIAAFIILSA